MTGFADDQRLAAHIRNSPLATIEFDPQLRIMRWSEEAERLFGWSADEAVGRVVDDLPWMYEEDEERVREEIGALISGERSRSVIHNRNYAKDGRVLHCRWHNSSIRDEEGRFVSIFSQVLDLSAATQAEEELERSRLRVKAILETAMDSFWITDAKGRIIWANESTGRLLGYSVEELLAMSIKDVEALESPEDVNARIKAMIETGYGRFESRHRKKDGTVIDVEVSCNYQPWDGGLFLAFVRDITARKASEARLIEREKWLRASQRAGRVGTYSFDMQADLWESTEVMDEIFGIPADFPKTFAGWISIIAPEQREWCLDHFKGLLEAKGRLPFNIQYKIIRPSDGEERWLHGRGEFVRNAAGEPVKLIGTISDITETIRVSSALMESEARFSGFMENLPAGAFIKDEEGRCLMANRFLRETLGWNDWLGKTAHELFPKEAADRFLADDRLALERGLTIQRSNLRDVRGNERIFEIYKFPLVLDGNKRLIGGIGIEITEKERMQEQLFRAQKLESLGVLAGGIAHDFNNILTGILGNLSLAEAMIGADSPASKFLAEGERAALRAGLLSQQLLTFSRGGEPVRKALDAAHVIDEAVGFALLGSNVKAELEIAQGLWSLDADEGQVNQLLNNLLINAKQAMPEGGGVRVRASNETVADEGAQRAPARGRYVRITVEDEGVGIPAADLSRVFDPYFTTKKGGTGLGLSSAYSIARRHGGSIAVSSEEGRGAVFSVLLPATDEAPECVVKEAASWECPAGGRVLVMDDEEMILDMLAAMLKSLGYTAQTCTDGAEAAALYAGGLAEGLPPDAVILDLTVPGGMGGLAAAKEILRVDPGARLVVSSGYSDDQVLADHGSHGFAGSIKKPYTRDKLSEELSRLLGRGSGPDAPA